MDAQNPYTVLGVSVAATKPQIREAYQKLASRLHPDRGGDSQRFMAIRESYELLMDDARRQAFDDAHPHLRIALDGREQVVRELIDAWLS